MKCYNFWRLSYAPNGHKNIYNLWKRQALPHYSLTLNLYVFVFELTLEFANNIQILVRNDVISNQSMSANEATSTLSFIYLYGPTFLLLNSVMLVRTMETEVFQKRLTVNRDLWSIEHCTKLEITCMVSPHIVTLFPLSVPSSFGRTYMELLDWVVQADIVFFFYIFPENDMYSPVSHSPSTWAKTHFGRSVWVEAIWELIP